ncbi:MAG: tetratricopeptide repeat protein [Rhizobiales bacterium]|nr:tetratricopeptide repeat protein [Hyphomicrobiales bacterium]
MLSQLGRWADAVADFDRAIALAPKFPDAHIGRAFALKGLARLDEALGREDEAKACLAKTAKLEASKPADTTTNANPSP